METVDVTGYTEQELKEMDVEVKELIIEDLKTNPNTEDLRMAPSNFKTEDTIGVSYEELLASEPDYLEYLEWAEKIVLERHEAHKPKMLRARGLHDVESTEQILIQIIQHWNPEIDSVTSLKDAINMYDGKVVENDNIWNAISELKWADKFYDEYAFSCVSEFFGILTIDHEGNCLVGEDAEVMHISTLIQKFENWHHQQELINFLGNSCTHPIIIEQLTSEIRAGNIITKTQVRAHISKLEKEL